MQCFVKIFAVLPDPRAANVEHAPYQETQMYGAQFPLVEKEDAKGQERKPAQDEVKALCDVARDRGQRHLRDTPLVTQGDEGTSLACEKPARRQRSGKPRCRQEKAP